MAIYAPDDFGYLDGAPPDVSMLMPHLAGELAHAKQAMQIWTTVFTKENVPTLESAAGEFFRWLRGAAQRDLVLAMCRLADPASTRVKGSPRHNATLHRLAELLPGIDGLTDAVEVYRVAVKDTIRPHRDRLISHSDEGASLGRAGDMPENVKTSRVGEILDMACAAYRLARRGLGDDGEIYFDLPGNGGADGLLATVKNAMQFHRERIERLTP